MGTQKSIGRHVSKFKIIIVCQLLRATMSYETKQCHLLFHMDKADHTHSIRRLTSFEMSIRNSALQHPSCFCYLNLQLTDSEGW